MSIDAGVILGQGFWLAGVTRLKNEEYFSEVFRRKKKVIHCFVPDSDLRAGHVSCFCPVVRLALDQYSWFFTTQIETMEFAKVIYPKRNRE